MSFITSLLSTNRPNMALLIGLIILAIGILFIRHWIRFVLIIPVLAIAIFIFGTFIVPLYQQGSDIEGFFRLQESSLIIIPFSTSTAQVILKPEEGTIQRFSAQKMLQQNIQGVGATQISFISHDTGEKAECFIQVPNGMLVQLYPQSALLLSGRYPNLEIQALQGNIVYTSGELSQATILIKGLHIDTQVDTYKNILLTDFQQKKNEYLSKTQSGLSENATINKLSKWYLDVLSYLSPSKYSKNLINYQEAQKYIEIPAAVQKIPAMTQNIIQQTTKGWEETKLYQRRQQLFR